MISRFFIDRPIFANVIAVITVLFGVVALYRLPVEQYPPITPPTVVVGTNYPGANAEVVAEMRDSDKKETPVAAKKGGHLKLVD